MGNKQAKTKSSSSSAKTTIKTLVECKEPSTKVETLPPLKLDYMEQIPKSDTLNHALETLATKLLRYFYMSGGDAQSTIVSPISIAGAHKHTANHFHNSIKDILHLLLFVFLPIQGLKNRF